MLESIKSLFKQNPTPETKLSELSPPPANGTSPPGGADCGPWWLISLLSTENQCLKAQVERLQAEKQDLQAENEGLKAALKLQTAKRFGKSSEKRDTQPDSTESDSAQAETNDTSPASKPPPKRKHGGQPGHRGAGRSIPAGLPRQEKVYDLPENERQCPDCGLPYKELPFTDDSEEVDVQVKVVVIRHRRKCYRKTCTCPGAKIVEPPCPPKLIPKGKFTANTWSKFLLDKYQGQLPITRQIQLLCHTGLPVAKSTVQGGFNKLQDYLEPLYQHFLAHLRTTQHLHADETRWMIFEDVEGKANHRWWLWVFASTSPKIVAFVLDPTRSAAVPKRTLSEPLPPDQLPAADSELTQAADILWIDDEPYRLSPHLKTISADRLRVYPAISSRIRVAFCWTHQRRDFTDFKTAHAQQPDLVMWADEWLDDIAHLYKLNDRRLAVRTQPAAFAAAQIELEAAITAMLDKFHARRGLNNAQRKIMESMDHHWPGLTIFVSNPDIPMDNNWAERLLRSPVLGRKNYNGHQTRRAGELGAIMFTLINTCLVNDLNPFDFLTRYFEACARHGGAPPDLTPFSPWLDQNLSPLDESLPP